MLYLIESEKCGKILVDRLDYIQKYDSLYCIKNIRFIKTPNDINLIDLFSVQVSKGNLVDCFYSDIKNSIDFAIPVEYLKMLHNSGINTKLLLDTCVTLCEGNRWQLLPLCFEAVQEIEKIKQIARGV